MDARIPEYRSIPLLALAVLLGHPALSAQQPFGDLRVTVTAAGTGLPLPGVIVRVDSTRAQAVTDTSGTVVLVGLEAGAREVTVSVLGYQPARRVVEVDPSRPTVAGFELEVEAIALEELKVRGRASVLQKSGFLDRHASGFGAFFTREDIERLRPRLMSDLLRRVAGVNLQSSGFGGSPRVSMRGTKFIGPCPIQFYLDGTPTSGLRVDDIQPSDVEGLEIYRGAASVPPIFNKGTSECGVIVIWTRLR